MLVLLGVLPGIAIGAALALGIAHWRGMFNVRVTVSVKPGAQTPSMSAVRVDERTVIVQPVMVVDWHVLYSAAEGSGHVVVPKEFAPPRH